jgi:hypothetical protein
MKHVTHATVNSIKIKKLYLFSIYFAFKNQSIFKFYIFGNNPTTNYKKFSIL